MSKISVFLLLIIGMLVGGFGAQFILQSQKIPPFDAGENTTAVNAGSDLYSAPWSQTDMVDVIDKSLRGTIDPSVMLVGAFGDYLVVPNRFVLASLNKEKAWFTTMMLLDAETGMTDFQLASLNLFDLSEDNQNTLESRQVRERRRSEFSNCYGIDIVLDRHVQSSSDLEILIASLYKDDFMVMISEGRNYELWKQILSRFSSKAGDDGRCLDEIVPHDW